MSFDVRPPGQAGANFRDDMTARIASARTSAPGRFARVYELEEARARRDHQIPKMLGDKIPDDVWQEVDRAAKLVEDLHDQGKQVMFDRDRLTGRVVASLLDNDGEITPMSLSDAVDPSAAARATGSGSVDEVA